MGGDMHKPEGSGKKGMWWSRCCGCDNNSVWGISLLGLGAYFLARDLGWIPSDISVWTVLLIAGGFMMFLKNEDEVCRR